MSKAGIQKTSTPEVQPSSEQPSTGGSIQALWGRFSQALAPRPATTATGTAQAGQKPPVGLGRMAIGLVAYMVGSMALEYLILFVDNIYHLKLTTTVQSFFPTSWPVVGSMTKFTLIYLLLLVAYVWLLFRLNVIPRDLFGARAAAARRNAAATTTTATVGRSKSARRRAGLTNTTSASATASHGVTTRRSGAAVRLAREEALKTPDGEDDEYHRVRSLNRRRRKR